MCIAPTPLSLGVINHNSERYLLNNNIDWSTSNGDYENTNCFIIGRATNTGFIIPAQHGQGDVIFLNGHVLSFPLSLMWFDNVSISFGYKFICDGTYPWYYYPSSGWIWTKSGMGVIKWSNDSLWGDLGIKEYVVWNTFGEPHFDDFVFYIGVKGFTGIRIGVLSGLFMGTALLVKTITKCPG